MRAIEVSGNERLAAEVMWLVRHLREALPDIAEEDLSRVFGDVAAHRLAQGARGFARLAGRRRAAAGRRRSPTTSPKRRACWSAAPSTTPSPPRCRGCATRSSGWKSGSRAWLGSRAWRASSPSACASGCTSSAGLAAEPAALAVFRSKKPRGSGCAKRSRRSARSSSSSARSCRRAATCCRSTSPTSSPSCRTRCRRSPPRLAVDEIERALGSRIDELFVDFEREPIASASIAQVHLARLHDGREVAVKVLRPRVEAGDREGRGAARDRRRPGRALLGGRPAAQAAPGGGRVRAPPRRRARPDARGGQRQPAAAQLRRLGAAAGARGALGLLLAARDGDGAHARHADLAGPGPAREGNRHPGPRPRRRRDLLHAGVPRRLLPRRHASRATSW